MRTFDVPLQEVYMTAYLQEKMPADPEEYRLPAIVVYPGGGYRHLSPREAEPIAMEFAAAGYQVFVLYYSLAPKRYPAPASGWRQGACYHTGTCGRVVRGSSAYRCLRLFCRRTRGSFIRMPVE